MGVSGLGCVAFSVQVLGPVSSPLGVSDLSLRHPAGGFFAGFASGFRWCLAVLSLWPGGCCFGRVWTRLRCVFCPGAGACFFFLGVAGLGCVAFSVQVLGPVSSPLGVSDLSLRHPAGEGFLLGLRPDLGGVWLF